MLRDRSRSGSGAFCGSRNRRTFFFFMFSKPLSGKALVLAVKALQAVIFQLLIPALSLSQLVTGRRSAGG